MALVLKTDLSKHKGHKFIMNIKQQDKTDGYTIVELVLVIIVLGILTAIGIISYNGWRQKTIETQMKSDLKSAVIAMENSRTFNNKYPTSVPSTFKASQGDTISGGSPDGGSYCIDVVNSQFPSLYYHIESTGGGHDVQSGKCITAGPFTLTYNAGPNGTISGVNPQIGIVSGGSGTLVTAIPSSNYVFSSWSDGSTTNPRTDTNVTADITVTASFVIDNISAPSTPTVIVSSQPTSTTTRWSWTPTPPSYTCQSGSSIRYQYNFTYNGYVGTWAGPVTAINADFTTSTEGYTYVLNVQAQCYNSSTGGVSAWSASGSASYFRPITTYTLSLFAGTGGTVSQSGASPYISGSTPTITATPNANYVFASWTGTNCSGTQSHAVPAMTANMTCTANFSLITYTLTLAAGAGGTVSQSGVSPYNSGSTPIITATPSAYYSFASWTGTNCTGTQSHAVPAMTANMTCTATFTATPITTPAAPVVTANTVSTNTTWSWPAVSCPGNSVRYQYRYTYNTSTPYDSGLIATATTSVAFTTSTENITYTVTVQAQCYNAVTSSSWSTAGSASYYRPVSLVTPATPNWVRVISTPISGYYWNIASCGAGNSSRYEHYWTDGPNHYDNNGNYIGDFTSPTYTYDAGTNTGPYSPNIGWQLPLVPSWYSGNTAAVYVRAQCYNGSNSSGWSAWGQGGVYTP